MSAGVGRYELFPESSKEPAIVLSRIETKPLPTRYPETRFGSGAFFYPTLSTLPTLPLMEGLAIPAVSRATAAFHLATDNGFTLLVRSGFPPRAEMSFFQLPSLLSLLLSPKTTDEGGWVFSPLAQVA